MTGSSSASAAVGPTLGGWILAVALGSFACGVVAGVVVPDLFAAEHRLDTPQEEAEQLTAKYGLSKQQHRRMLMVLEEHYRADWNILRSANPSQLDPEIRSRRLLQSRKTEQRKRFVLDEQQRALYDRDSTKPLSPGASSSAGEQQNR